jgi:hypothetical protein
MTAATCLLALSATVVVAADTYPVTLTWEAPSDGGPVGHYDVYWVVDGSAPRVIETVTEPTAVIECEQGVEYYFTVKAVSPNDDELESIFSPASEMVFVPEQASDGSAPPSSPSFLPNYPNPFNPETKIRYGIPSSHEVGSPVVLEIYDVRGQRVRTFQVEDTPGWHEVTWNGRGDDGSERPSGHYVLRLICDGEMTTWKMTMVK